MIIQYVVLSTMIANSKIIENAISDTNRSWLVQGGINYLE